MAISVHGANSSPGAWPATISGCGAERSRLQHTGLFFLLSFLPSQKTGVSSPEGGSGKSLSRRRAIARRAELFADAGDLWADPEGDLYATARHKQILGKRPAIDDPVIKAIAVRLLFCGPAVQISPGSPLKRPLVSSTGTFPARSGGRPPIRRSLSTGRMPASVMPLPPRRFWIMRLNRPLPPLFPADPRTSCSRCASSIPRAGPAVH